MEDQGGTLRIGDGEREAAVEALVAHREAGRLDPVEFEERQVTASRARTWAEIGPLFADLPDPRPVGMPASVVPAIPAGHGAVVVPPPGEVAPQGVLGGLVPERYRNTIMALMPFVALGLFFATEQWIFFLLIPVVAILLYGSEGHHDHRGHRRDRRR